MTFTAVNGSAVTSLHDELLSRTAWPQTFPADLPSADSSAAVWHWIAINHRNNCLLWAEEDLARRTRVSDSEIAANKRAIDGFNQARNDATERVDELLLLELGLVDADSVRTDAPVSRIPADARLNSETAGSMIDRLSIMALKINAMRAQTQRTDVGADHVDASRVKLDRLLTQRNDLAGCLDRLLADCRDGAAYFKVYRQFKMYNDARFNPALVAEQAAQQRAAGQ
jgi:hypothetical protein